MAKKTTRKRPARVVRTKGVPASPTVNGAHEGVKYRVVPVSNGITVEVKADSGGFVRLNIDKWGRVQLDHAKVPLVEGQPIEDERTILKGAVSYAKRTFDVYSTSGYVNHYKGKPMDPTSVPSAGSAGTGTPLVSTGKTGSSAPTGASAPTSTKATSTPTSPSTPGKSESKPRPIADPHAFAVGEKVQRVDTLEVGEVVGMGNDTIGDYVEIEWEDHGYASLYKDDLKSQGVSLVGDEPLKEATSTLTASAAYEKTPTSVSGTTPVWGGLEGASPKPTATATSLTVSRDITGGDFTLKDLEKLFKDLGIKGWRK